MGPTATASKAERALRPKQPPERRGGAGNRAGAFGGFPRAAAHDRPEPRCVLKANLRFDGAADPRLPRPALPRDAYRRLYGAAMAALPAKAARRLVVDAHERGCEADLAALIDATVPFLGIGARLPARGRALWKDDPDDLRAIEDLFTALEAATPGKVRAPGSSGTAQALTGKLGSRLHARARSGRAGVIADVRPGSRSRRTSSGLGRAA